jgi:CRISPR-associated protein (TIGR02710 family)
VGGSHQPILTAIRELAPEHVVFVCSGRDPGTGRHGSDQYIVAGGLVIKSRDTDVKPSLPNIPTQAGLAPHRFEVVLVPADDLDQAFAGIDRTLSALRERFPEARLVADYTGGTKTMSAALVAAALEYPDMQLQIVTGNRVNLVRVLEGMQAAAPASVNGIRIRRAIEAHVSAWARFAYEEAAQGLVRVSAPASVALRAQLSRARDLSDAFAAWDRFDHREARRRLEPYASEELAPHMNGLRVLAGEASPKREGLQIWDLWLNAQRRAAAGRYDDAVARVYRMIEWTAQWVLLMRVGLDTADIPPEKIPPDPLAIAPNRQGKYQAGLFAAWQLVAAHTQGPAAQFFATHEVALRGQLDRRNSSILAHGYTPIDASAWSGVNSWIEERFIPMLREEILSTQARALFPQLPDRYTFEP